MSTMHLRRIAAAAAVAALPLAACAPAGGVAAGPMPGADGDLAAHAFLSAVDMNEIDMAMVAQDRAMDPTVRMYAMHMISSHSNALQARETRLAQRGAGLGLATTAWTPAATRWTTVAAPMRPGGMQPAAGAARPEGELQPAGAQTASGVPPHGPPAHVQTADPQPEGRKDGVQSLPAQNASGVPPHGPPAHLQDVEVEGRMQHGHMHGGAMPMTWIGATMRHEPVLTPAGIAALRSTLVANPASRPLAEAAERDLARLRGLSGAQFDMAYIDAQVTAHRYALENLDATLAAGAVSPEMMGTVQATRAMIAAHLETAEAIRARL